MKKHDAYIHGKGVKKHEHMLHHPGRNHEDFHGDASHSKAHSGMPPMAPPEAPAGGPPDMQDNDTPGSGI
jgi:hypothetical protein